VDVRRRVEQDRVGAGACKGRRRAVPARGVEQTVGRPLGDSPTAATAIARKSQAKASGAPWKLRHDRMRPFGSTIGLSIVYASSAAATRRAWATVSRAAPRTYGAQRSE
jgi:hypothetical protein